MIVKVKSSLETCWLDFFSHECSVLVVEKNSKNGHTNPPILVFGQNENYSLNSPQKYVCNGCRDNSKDRQNHEPKLPYDFASTTSEILQQIGDRYPEIMNLFPCHITHQNAIDKKLMNLIIHNAVKGIGPIATRESLVAWHELEWQKCENLWANFVLDKLNQPTTNQRNTNRADIEKCPHYFSLELGGCVPTGSWLVHMFCSTVQKMRHCYDSECIKRAKTSKVIVINANYKVPKWMMKWGSGQIYDALHSGTSEYNAIIMQRFSTSDNHEELSSNLKTLSELGVSPYLCFSDDPSRDESILKKTFSNLGDYIKDSDNESTDKDDLQELTSTKTIMYLHTYDNALTILSQFVKDVNEVTEQKTTDKVIIALDTEWPVYFERGEHHEKKTSRNINIVQLGSNETDYTVLLELYSFVDNAFHLAAIGQKLRAIFNLDVDSITGCNHKVDYSRLRKQYPYFNLPDKEIYSKMEDVTIMSLNHGVIKRGHGNMTLQALCKGQGILLKKPQHVRLGTCFASRNGSLSKDAQIYCQLDVETVLALHKIYSDLPNLTKPLTPNTIPPVGSLVDIMPECGSSIYPLAQGTIRQIGSGSWLSNGIRLTKNQIVITVWTVFNTKGIIHYPCDEKRKKICSCGRGSHGKIHDKCDFYLKSQLGKSPFQVMELLSHVRLYIEQVLYPPCYYDTEEAENTQVEVLTNFMHGTNTVEIDSPEQEEDTMIGSLQPDDDNYTVNSTDSSDNDFGINPQALEHLDEDTGNVTTIASDNDDDLDEDTNMLEQPTPSEV